MPLLSSEEAFDVSDGFMLILYGDEVFSRWKELKDAMRFGREREFVSWLIDVANHYKNSERVGDNQDGEQNNVKIESQRQCDEVLDNVYSDASIVYDIGDDDRASDSYDYQGNAADVKRKYGTMELANNHSAPLIFGDSTEGLHNIPIATSSREKSKRTQESLQMDYNSVKQEIDVNTSSDHIQEVDIYQHDRINHEGYVEDEGEPGLRASHVMDPSPAVVSLTEDLAPIGGQSVGDRLCGGVRQYACPHCPYTSPCQSNVRTHVEGVHRRLKPHQCPQCAFRCSQRANLRRHLLLRHQCGSGGYACGRCGRRYMAPSALRRHELCCRGTGAPNSP